MLISQRRATQQKMDVQNSKMGDQIVLLIEKLEFFIDHVKKEQGRGKRGEYFKIKDEEFKGKQLSLILYRKGWWGW